METKDLLTIQEAAAAIGVHRNTIYIAMQEGRLPYAEVLGHKAIKRSDVEAYQQRTRVSGEKPKGRPKGSRGRKKDSELEAGEQA